MDVEDIKEIHRGFSVRILELAQRFEDFDREPGHARARDREFRVGGLRRLGTDAEHRPELVERGRPRAPAGIGFRVEVRLVPDLNSADLVQAGELVRGLELVRRHFVRPVAGDDLEDGLTVFGRVFRRERSA